MPGEGRMLLGTAVATGTGQSWQQSQCSRMVRSHHPIVWGDECGPLAVDLRSTVNVSKRKVDVIEKWECVFVW